jgi:hypothetical protein
MDLACFSHENTIASQQIFLNHEYIFIFDLVYNFFIEYYPDHSGKTAKPIRQLSKIAMHYLRTTFFIDFIPLIPFHLIELPHNKGPVLYIIKLIRFKRGIDLFDIQKMVF